MTSTASLGRVGRPERTVEHEGRTREHEGRTRDGWERTGAPERVPMCFALLDSFVELLHVTASGSGRGARSVTTSSSSRCSTTRASSGSPRVPIIGGCSPMSPTTFLPGGTRRSTDTHARDIASRVTVDGDSDGHSVAVRVRISARALTPKVRGVAR